MKIQYIILTILVVGLALPVAALSQGATCPDCMAPRGAVEIRSTYAAPGSIVRLGIEVNTCWPIRTFEIEVSFNGNQLQSCGGYVVEQYFFPTYPVTASQATDSSWHFGLATVDPFCLNGRLVSAYFRVPPSVPVGTMINVSGVASYNDTTHPPVLNGTIIVVGGVQWGDVNQNGSTTLLDVVEVLEHVVYDSTFTLQQYVAANLDGGPTIDMYDAYLVMSRAINPTYCVPVDASCNQCYGSSSFTTVASAHLEGADGGLGLVIDGGVPLTNGLLELQLPPGVTVEAGPGLTDAMYLSSEAANGRLKLAFVHGATPAAGAPIIILRGSSAGGAVITGTINNQAALQVAGAITGVEGTGVQPSAFALEQNYPNPFNPTTTISYTLPEAAYVQLSVYNMLGEEVAGGLVNAWQGAGTHEAVFNASNLPSGVYQYRLTTGAATQTKKMLLMK